MFVQQLSTQSHIIVHTLECPTSAQHRIRHIEMTVAYASNGRTMRHRMQLQADLLHQLGQILFVLVDRVHLEREIGSLEVNAFDAVDQRQLIVDRPDETADGQIVGGLRKRIDAAQFEHFLLVRSLNGRDERRDLVGENVRIGGSGNDAGIAEIILGGHTEATGNVKDTQQFAFANVERSFGAVVDTQNWRKTNILC